VECYQHAQGESNRAAGVKHRHRDLLNVRAAFGNFLNPMQTGEDEDSMLYCVSSDQLASDAVSASLLSYVSVGEEAAVTFIQQRLVEKSVTFHQPMHKLKLKTFQAMAVRKQLASSKQKTVKVNAERNLLGQLLMLPEDLTEQQRNMVEDVLDELNPIFSKGPYDMGRTTLVEHTIDTGNHRPIRQGLCRHPIAHLEVTDKQVDNMVRNDIVKPAASPWASNVVLVRKDGSYRLCIDYRALNSVTHSDTYPLPHIDTCLGSMDGTLDLRSSYHNIPIRETD